jgi:hypothetical protein
MIIDLQLALSVHEGGPHDRSTPSTNHQTEIAHDRVVEESPAGAT